MTNKQKGFTLTELMLSLTFISMLILFLMTAVIQLTRLYNKGLAVRQLNQSGRQFSEDFTRTARYANMNDVKWDAVNKRLCINGVTYAWNEGDPYTLPPASIKNKYSGAGPVITLVRTKDPGGTLCFNPTAAIIPNDDRTSAILPDTLNVNYVGFSISALDPRLARLSVVLSTGGGNAPVSVGGVPTASSTGFECPGGAAGVYCALADFDTTVYMRN